MLQNITLINFDIRKYACIDKSMDNARIIKLFDEIAGIIQKESAGQNWELYNLHMDTALYYVVDVDLGKIASTLKIIKERSDHLLSTINNQSKMSIIAVSAEGYIGVQNILFSHNKV